MPKSRSPGTPRLTGTKVQFARANALLAYKSSSLPDIGGSVQQMIALQEEIKLHIEFCKEYGLQVEDIEREPEDQGTMLVLVHFE